MGQLKNAIKDNLLVWERSKSLDIGSKRVGEVITVDEANDMCEVEIVSGSDRGRIITATVETMGEIFGSTWLPKPGDFVDMYGKNGCYVITSKAHTKSFISDIANYFDDFFSDNTGGGCGNAGI